MQQQQEEEEEEEEEEAEEEEAEEEEAPVMRGLASALTFGKAGLAAKIMDLPSFGKMLPPPRRRRRRRIKALLACAVQSDRPEAVAALLAGLKERGIVSDLSRVVGAGSIAGLAFKRVTTARPEQRSYYSNVHVANVGARK